jgi:hypothetical protein
MAGVWVRFVDGVRYHRSLVTDLRALEQTKTDRLRAVTGSRPRL